MLKVLVAGPVRSVSAEKLFGRDLCSTSFHVELACRMVYATGSFTDSWKIPSIQGCLDAFWVGLRVDQFCAILCGVYKVQCSVLTDFIQGFVFEGWKIFGWEPY